MKTLFLSILTIISLVSCNKKKSEDPKPEPPKTQVTTPAPTFAKMTASQTGCNGESIKTEFVSTNGSKDSYKITISQKPKSDVVVMTSVWVSNGKKYATGITMKEDGLWTTSSINYMGVTCYLLF